MRGTDRAAPTLNWRALTRNSQSRTLSSATSCCTRYSSPASGIYITCRKLISPSTSSPVTAPGGSRLCGTDDELLPSPPRTPPPPYLFSTGPCRISSCARV
ncbi:unnamed protein product [Boreogadus saida]